MVSGALLSCCVCRRLGLAVVLALTETTIPKTAPVLPVRCVPVRIGPSVSCIHLLQPRTGLHAPRPVVWQHSSSTQQSAVGRPPTAAHHGHRGPVPGLHRQPGLYGRRAMRTQGGLLPLRGAAAVCHGGHPLHAVQAGQPGRVLHPIHG